MDRLTSVLLAIIAVLFLALVFVIIVAARKPTMERVRSITNILFLTGQGFAIIWINLTYGIAIYSTVKFGQPFPVEQLSEEAMRTLLGVVALKIIENIFEHNNGSIFGQSDSK